jgi:hypothetical protein
MYDTYVAKIKVEKAFNCTEIRSLAKTEGLIEDTPLTEQNKKGLVLGFQSEAVDFTDNTSKVFESRPNTWNVVESDERCLYTDCYVGNNGDPSDCFNCYKSTGCTNGCGPDGGIRTDGNFGIYSFGEPCCHHDFCYSSVYDKTECDSKFLKAIMLECPRVPIQFGFMLAPMK